MKKFLQKLFSVKNENEYKVIMFLGIKFKFRNNNLVLLKIKQDTSNINNLIKDICDIKNQFSNIRNNILNKRSLLWQGIMDTCPNSFKDYILTHNMPEEIAKLMKNLDVLSLKFVDITINKIIQLPDYTYSKFLYIDDNEFKSAFQTPENQLFDKLYEQCNFKVRTDYKLSKDDYDMEVFIYHHGLKYTNEKIKNYIKGKDFIDAGAYIGDSAIVLMEYMPNKIHSFEIANTHIKNYIQTMEINNISDEKYSLVQYALSDKDDVANIIDDGGMGVKIYNDSGYQVKSTTLDSYLKSKDCIVGFIKADIEGAMYKALLGMRETIKKHRPVLSFAIYHSPEEFFKTKPLLDEITKDLNYTIEIDCHFSQCYHIYGTVIWAYPKELEN